MASGVCHKHPFGDNSWDSPPININMTATFHNYSDKAITAAYNKVSYTVQPGDKVLLERHIALHLAKYLAFQVLNDANQPILLKTPAFKAQVMKAIIDGTLVDDEGESIEDDAVKVAQAKQKRNKGKVKEVIVEAHEEVFEGLE
jgi:hypothetical protein